MKKEEKNILFIGNGFDLLHNIKIEVHDFVNSLSKKKYRDFIHFYKNQNKWSDIEEIIFQYLDAFPSKRKITFIKKIILDFEKWLINIPKNPILKEEFKIFLEREKIFQIISLNFTNTMEIYNYEKLTPNNQEKNTKYEIKEKSFVNIHQIEGEYKYIFGYDKDEKLNKINLTEKLNNKYFKPKKQILQKIKLDNEIRKIFFIGISLKNSDYDLIDFILKSNKKEIFLLFFSETDEKNYNKLFLNKKNVKIINLERFFDQKI